MQRRVLQIADHLVDVVLHERDFALGLDLNRTCQVALRHRRGHVGDGAQLGGQVRGEAIHVVGQIAPRSRGSGHAGLAAELSFNAHLARDRGRLLRERRQGVGHAVDRIRELGNFALGLDQEFLFQVSLGHRGHDFRNAAHLVGQVAGHEIHAVGQIAPGSAHALHHGLAPQFSFRAYFAGHARHFGSERVQLVHHRIDSVFQFQDLAFYIDRDLLRQIAARDRGGDGGDVSHLRGQVRRHEVHRVGQIFPGAGDAFDPRLATEGSFRTHLARHTRNFRGERAKLVHHGIDRIFQFQNLAADVHGDLLGQIAVGDRGCDVGDVSHLAGQIARHRVDRIGQIFPRSSHALHLGLATQLPFRSHLAGHARHLGGERAELIHHGVDGVF